MSARPEDDPEDDVVGRGPTAGGVLRWQYRRSLASRVTLLTTMAVGLSVAAMALGAYVSVRMQMLDSLDESLQSRARTVVDSGALTRLRSYQLPAFLLGAADVRVYLVGGGQIVALDNGPLLSLGRRELAVADGGRAVVRSTVDENGRRYRVATVGDEKGNALSLAQPLDAQERVLSKAGAVLFVFGGVGILAAALAGWGVAANGLRPVRKLTSAVEEIARTEDLTPLRVEGDDEIARLATAFNAMLTALAASRDRQRQLVADASHELRTPLTSLRTNLDLLAQADHAGGLPAEARSELLRDVRAQIEELTTLIGDLVELARDDPSSLAVDRLDFADVIDRAVARVRRRAPSLAFSVHAEAWPVVGDSAALERAVTNLLDNAAKWSPPGATVTVTLGQGTLTVDDEGPGIHPDDAPHVFDRFYRSDESRGMPGSGLGLAIVQQVADRHSGTVSAGRAPGGGARLTLRLPPSPAPHHPVS